jgi:hypothetical protein
MKKILTLMIACAAITASAQTDSISTLISFHVPKAEPQVVHYPYITPISSHEELSHEVMQLNFSKADAAAKKLITTARRRRESTADFDKVVSICHKGENGLRGVDRVVIVDSVVVDKKEFLKAYPLSADLGSLKLSNKGDIVQYQTQLNGMVLRPEGTDSTNLQLIRYYLENDRLVEGEVIEGLGIEGDINYPFLMPDGQTFYFAARCDEGYGNYDLYATRYDNDSKRFYQAENMGFPYNSYANDYMLVIDEAARLGWFASDRYQPDGKVCIYTFIPNDSRQTIDYETTDIDELRAAASLQSLAAIPMTDEQQQARTGAFKRIKQLTSTASTTRYKEFEFILNDAKTCYTLDDFTSADAKQLCREWMQKTKNLTALNEQLQQMRETSPNNRQPILNLETRIMELQSETHNLAKQIRSVELSK